MIVDITIKDEFYNIKYYEIKFVDYFYITKDTVVCEKLDGDIVEIAYSEILKINCFG